MEIEISKLSVSKEEGRYVRWHPNYRVLKGNLPIFQDWCKTINQDWRERLFRILWVYMFIKEEGQTRPIDVDKNFRIITGHKRAAAMLAQGHKTIKVNIVDYEKIGQK